MFAYDVLYATRIQPMLKIVSQEVSIWDRFQASRSGEKKEEIKTESDAPRRVITKGRTFGDAALMVLGHGSSKQAHKRELTSTEHSQAGLVSGVVSRACIQPLDVLKIRFQLQEEPLHGHGRGKYWGVFQAISLIRKEEGVKALWKGHIPAQGLSACYGIVQFTSFDFLSWHANRFSLAKKYGTICDFTCGALAGSLAMASAMPLDVIRTRLVAQGDPPVYRGTGHAILKIWQREGIVGYFKGLSPSLLQIAPFTESSSALVSGAIAGSCAKTILYPLDMVRHRLQIVATDRSTNFGRTTQHRGLVSRRTDALYKDGKGRIGRLMENIRS
uniref:Mitochondrial thiamine pyrophosphate carrier 1 n=1 Tax=Steinernema glaseri TaxID=37863 RepID=A0A1I7ZJN1_9BILA